MTRQIDRTEPGPEGVVSTIVAALETTRVAGDLTSRRAAEWDRFVDGVEQSDVSQLHGWSRVRAAAGYSPLYLFMREGGRLVAGTQVLARRIPVLGWIGYLPNGPVVEPSASDAVIEFVADGLQALVSDGSLRMLFVQPPWGTEQVSKALLARGFRPSDAGTAPAASARIDLSEDLEQIRSRLNSGVRRWTRRAAEREVSVRRGSRTDLPLLAELHARSAVHQGFRPMSLEYLQRQYDELSPDNVVLFVGEVDGSPVAVDLFTSCGDTLKLRFVGMNRDGRASKLSVPAVVKWHALTWAKSRGMRWFDLGGLEAATAREILDIGDPDPERISGGDRFKLSFGAEPYLLPQAVELARPMRLLTAYDIARRSGPGRTVLDAARRRLRGGMAARGGALPA